MSQFHLEEILAWLSLGFFKLPGDGVMLLQRIAWQYVWQWVLHKLGLETLKSGIFCSHYVDLGMNLCLFSKT